MPTHQRTTSRGVKFAIDSSYGQYSTVLDLQGTRGGLVLRYSNLQWFLEKSNKVDCTALMRSSKPVGVWYGL